MEKKIEKEYQNFFKYTEKEEKLILKGKLNPVLVRCKKCLKTYPATTEFFNKHRDCKYGLELTCKKCKRVYDRNRHMLKNYGISLKIYNSMIKEQKNQCAVCGIRFTNNFIAHVDHDHKTGEVRDLLCINCNTFIGAAKDNLIILVKGIKYLEKHKKSKKKG